jgi:2,3-bisphosphoglycerate-independent phosphoglycerate mutase
MDLTPLIQPADTKILLVVMDGLGGYADAEHGTELEEAATPNLDWTSRHSSRKPSSL